MTTGAVDEATTATGKGGALRPLRHRSFRLLWLGQLTSQVGDWVAFVALTGLVWELTEAGRWVAALRATHAAPILLLGPLAGVFADRWDRRGTMLAVDLVRAGLMGALAFSGALAAAFGFSQLAAILALSLVFELASLLFAPAKNAVLPLLVPPEDLLAANGLSAATGTAALLVGPALGGLVVAWLGVGGALALDALTFAVSAATVALLRVPPVPAGSRLMTEARGRAGQVLAELRAGFRHVRTERTALATVALEGIAMLAYGALSVLAVVLAERRLGLDPRGYGALLAAFGGGALLGSLVVGAVERRLGPRATLAAGFALVAAGTLPLAGVGAFAPALLGYACAGFGQMVVSVVGLTLFQRAVADEVLGRAFSIYNTVSHGVLLLVTTGAAALADLVALGPTLALAGLSQLLGVAGTLRWLSRRGGPRRRTADEGTGRARVP